MADNNDRDKGKFIVDLTDLELPKDVLDKLEEEIEKLVRKTVFESGSKWGNVVWKDPGWPRGGTRGIIGNFPDGER